MPWAGGSYTKGNSATGGWTGDASLGIGIEAGRHDTQDNDFATGINQCLNKDGSNSATGNLNIGSFKLTSVANGAARNDAATLGQVQDSTSSYLGTTGGTSTAFTVTATPTITSLVTGAFYSFKANAANGAAATLKIDGTAATTMQRQGTALAGNEFKANDLVQVQYDGTNFQIVNIAPAPLFIDRTNNRVGVGTTAPSHDFSVAGTGTTIINARFSADSSGPILAFRKSRNASIDGNTIVQGGDALGNINFQGNNGSGYNTAAAIIGFVDGTPGATNDMPGGLIFYTCADGTATLTERLRITNAGSVGVNGYNTDQFSVWSSAAGTSSASFINTNAGDAGTVTVKISKQDNNNGVGASNFLGFWINGGATGSGKIASNNAGAAAFFTFSDQTLKENIVNLPPQLDNILGLRPIEFDYKDGSGHQIGFIAQEVELVYPDNVYTDDNGLKSLGDMSRMDARIIKAIQDLNNKVELLTDRVEALEP